MNEDNAPSPNTPSKTSSSSEAPQPQGGNTSDTGGGSKAAFKQIQPPLKDDVSESH